MAKRLRLSTPGTATFPDRQPVTAYTDLCICSGMLNPQSLNFFVNHPELALPKKAGPKAQAKL